MANDLTGDFDVVAEFTLDAANRVLAAMHRGKRFPHSLTLRIRDTHKPFSLHDRVLTAVSVVDRLGEAAANPALAARQSSVTAGLLHPSNPLFSELDATANAPRKPTSEEPGLGDYTGLEGIAQLQVSTPKITIPDQSGTRLTVHMRTMARWVADPGTAAMPELLRGEIRITAGVSQVASQAGKIVEVNLNPKNIDVSYIDSWHSIFGISKVKFGGSSLTADDVKKISQVIRNAIATSFQPSNAVLPPSVQSMQFKGLAGNPAGIAVLLNLTGGPGNPGSLGNVFLSPGDGFAYAASGDFLLGVFDSLTAQLNSLQINFTSTLADYTGTVSSVKVELQEGQFLLTLDGDAVTESIIAPNFSFTVTQAFTLSLCDAAGGMSGPIRTAQLALAGDISFVPHRGGIARAIIDAFTSQILDNLRQVRDDSVAAMQPSVRAMLSADRNLGGFLKSLMNPSIRPANGAPLEELDPDLRYTSFEIHAAGIVLHGSLDVPASPGAHAEFAILPDAYNALNSWIPGGTIQSFTWSVSGYPPYSNSNVFMYGDPPAGAFSGVSICLTVQGTRVSTSGPAAEIPVSATTCRHMSFPVSRRAHTFGLGFSNGGGRLPLIALTRAAASGGLDVVGHASPWAASDAPVAGSNWVVHFPDEKSFARLEELPSALRQSGRADAPAAVLAVLAPDQLRRAKPVASLLLSDDADRAWEKYLGIGRRPGTAIIAASGEIVWRHEGDLPIATLVEALRKHLHASGPFIPRLLQSPVRIGEFPPNFVFVYASGREMTLRKLVGRPVVLFFWSDSSKASVDALRELSQTIARDAKGHGPVLLAINSGAPPEEAHAPAGHAAASAILVPDPGQEITLAYGINIWPAMFILDALGVVRDIRYGALQAGARGIQEG